ncbi:MAG: hypothetical protein Tsb0018_01420 [Opitutales bacterium]
MKKNIITLLAICGFAFGLHAADKPQLILTADMNELFNNYYKAQDAQDKFQGAVEKAQAEVQDMIQSGMALVQQLQDLQAKATAEHVSEEKREAYGKEVEEMREKIRQKEVEVNEFRQQTDRTLAQRRQSLINTYISEIQDVVTKIAKDRGADYVINQAGPALIYFKPNLDITKEALKELNKDKPIKAVAKENASSKPKGNSKKK